MNRGFPSNCGCGAGITTFTSGTQENPGRPFFRCETRGEDHLFKWVEEAMLEEVEDVLPKVEVHGTEIAKMKAEIEELMEICLNNKIEIQKNKAVTKCLVVYACIVSVAFGAYVLY
ncbi:uncharacterized protein At1g43920, Chloroplastic-like [Raphanus sativus]|uniref:Uncharacterized protein At1g43920, Chloroplastic-like n=1 Tax=Raphanus sativus TaxID=3726 RepID=A0A6J0M7D8_RAPSA|nr:uncharacterized protein At1g43920, Chloroplastic-like [Raphanus sativus]